MQHGSVFSDRLNNYKHLPVSLPYLEIRIKGNKIPNSFLKLVSLLTLMHVFLNLRINRVASPSLEVFYMLGSKKQKVSGYVS